MSRLNLRKRPRISYYEPEEPNLDEYVFCTECADFVYEYCAIHGPLLVIPDDKIYDGNKRPSHVIDGADASRSNWMRYVNCSRHWREQNLLAYQYQGHIYYRTIKIVPRFTELMVFYGSEFANMLHVDLGKYNSPSSYAEKLGALAAISTSVQRTKNLQKHCEEKPIEVNHNILKPSPLNTGLPQSIRSSEFKKSKKLQYNISNKHKNTEHLDQHSDIDSDAAVKKIKHNNSSKSNINNKSNNKCLVKSKTISEKHKPVHIVAIDKFNMKRNHNISDKENSVENCNNKKNASKLNQVDQNHVYDKYNLSCDICPFKTTTKVNLVNHLKAHAAVKSFDCHMCPYKSEFKYYLEQHVISHTEVKLYKCNICNYSCKRKTHLKIHLRTHTGEKPYKCHICSYTCTCNSSLKIHLRTHTGEKPYKCHICSYTCTCNSSLKIHLRTHTSEKPYKCHICSYTCAQNSTLKTHLRTHTGEKPYKCHICSYTCTCNSSLKRHLRTHTGEKPYICDICRHSYSNKGCLKKHLTTHSS